jgi:hypothetical protein
MGTGDEEKRLLRKVTDYVGKHVIHIWGDLLFWLASHTSQIDTAAVPAWGSSKLRSKVCFFNFTFQLFAKSCGIIVPVWSWIRNARSYSSLSLSNGQRQCLYISLFSHTTSCTMQLYVFFWKSSLPGSSWSSCTLCCGLLYIDTHVFELLAKG